MWSIKRRGGARAHRRSAPARLSRPTRATVSKMPGEIVVPVSATRSGWNTCLAFIPDRSTAARSAGSTVSGVHGAGTAARRRAHRGERLARPLRGPGTSRGRPGRRPASLEERPRERPELVERGDLLLGDRDRLAQAAVAGERLQPRGQVVDGQLAQVAAVDPAQLLLVEDRRRLRDALEREALLQLLRGEEGRARRRSPSRAAPGSCAPPRGGSRASRSSCTEAAPWRLESFLPSGPCSSGRCA